METVFLFVVNLVPCVKEVCLLICYISSLALIVFVQLYLGHKVLILEKPSITEFCSCSLMRAPNS